MLSNYLKTALRNLLRNKLHATLNLAGLGIGLACGLLIALYIASEMRYDRYHSNADNTWRVTRTFHDQDGSENLHLSAIAPPFGTLLPQHFPEIQQITRVLKNFNAVIRTENNQMFTEQNAFFADENLFKVFTVPMTSGDPETALTAPWQVALSESTARRYFGNNNPMDQILRVDGQFRLKVTGVFRDFPKASHWHPDILFSFASLRDSTVYGVENLQTNFGNNAFYTYFTVGPNFDPEKMAARFPKFLDDVFPAPKHGATTANKPSSWTKLHLQKLTDIHLQSHHDDEIEPGGDLARVRMFGVIALVILLIAGINYINLSTAFSLRRAREIGVRKSTGAQRGQIVAQFLAESLLLSTGASVLGFGLAVMALPLLKKTLGLELAPDLLSLWYVPFVFLGVALATGILAGLYPAIFMSSFRPAAVLKGSSSSAKGGVYLRKALVVFQFGISVALLVGTFIIYRQLHFMQSKSLGLDKERIVTLAQNGALLPKWDAFRAELLNSPYVVKAGRSSRLPSGNLLDYLNGTSVQIGDTMSPLNVTLSMLTVDMDFTGTYQIPLAAGRAFSRDFPTDTTQAWMLNEAAVRAIGWPSAEAAIGKRLIYGGREDCYIVGVLRDFHFESLHKEIIPMIFFIPREQDNLNAISIKIAGDTPAALAHIKQVWETFNPDFPFDYSFLDESYGALYEAEMRQGNLYMVFAGLAILIACLGLFGLATFAAHQRTKEIGIRKVLGASVAGITGLLATDFLKLVLVAIVLATPVAYWMMRAWLADFAYRVDMQWWIFALSGLLAVLVAFLTVSFQSIKAALTNPVESLRSE
ncbi:MAG: ABC transporter permease [Saprospiraceae bacterium]|nr:ABC transporter permease [Saprospiraceae bacterium]